MLGYDTVPTGKQSLTFWRSLLPSSSGQAVLFLECLEPIDPDARGGKIPQNVSNQSTQCAIRRLESALKLL
jgi:hypothetical protein